MNDRNTMFKRQCLGQEPIKIIHNQQNHQVHHIQKQKYFTKEHHHIETSIFVLRSVDWYHYHPHSTLMSILFGILIIAPISAIICKVQWQHKNTSILFEIPIIIRWNTLNIYFFAFFIILYVNLLIYYCFFTIPTLHYNDLECYLLVE